MAGDQKEAETLADRLVDRWTAGAVTAKGSCPADPRIAPGGSVEITDAGPASGTYHVTEVEHSYSARGFETRFTAGDRRPSSLVDVLSTERPSSFRRDGLVVGIVTMVGNSAGSAGDVKVKYVSIGDQVESNWARIVTLGAGSQRGMTFLPEINDEVIVGFEGGDARRPVILGGLFNGKDVPVEFGVQNNTVSQRRITSRLGHFVEFGDGTDTASQHIDLNLAGGKHQVRLGKDKLTASVPAGIPVTITAGTLQDRDRPGRLDHPGRQEDHPEIRDRRGDLGGQHHREGERQGRHLRHHDGGQGVGNRRGLGGRRDDHQGRHGGGELMEEIQVPAAGSTEPAQHDASFVGRGFFWPMEVDHTGSIRLTDGAADIDAAMAVVLATAPGERVMRPDFGCRIWDLLFEPVTANLLGLMAQAVRDALTQWEPRVIVETVDTVPDPTRFRGGQHPGRLPGEGNQRPAEPGVPVLRDPA